MRNSKRHDRRGDQEATQPQAQPPQDLFKTTWTPPTTMDQTPSTLDFPDNHRSTSATSIGHQLDPQQQYRPTAFTLSGAEVARLPRQQFQSTTKFPAYQWGGWGRLQLGNVANSQSWEHDIHNREQHWFQSQGTEDCSQRDEDKNDESQGELNFF